MREIKKYVTLLSMSPKVVSAAGGQFEKLRETMKIFTGYNMEHIAVAVLYVAINLCNLPFSLKRLCEVSGFDDDKIGSVYMQIQKYCDLPDKKDLSFIETKEAKTLRLLCKHLNLARETANKAEVILKKIIDEYLLNGKTDTKIAVAIYAALTQESTSSGISLEMISKEVGPAVKTVRENYKKIAEKIIFE